MSSVSLTHLQDRPEMLVNAASSFRNLAVYATSAIPIISLEDSDSLSMLLNNINDKHDSFQPISALLVDDDDLTL